ncbi:hypothetical protein [Actinomadura formosensis]|uniref:hypothetical protein n=1 Tax=Actinomadura formosensis TaxID=60706 RepID=UPI001040E3A3|nr:hypothetical protein [Actinomadura formosensis]
MITLVRVWDDPGDPAPPGTERVLIGGRVLVLWRSPSAAGGPVRTPCDEHLVAGVEETSRARLSCADVIVRRGGEPARLRADHPGCLVIAVNTRRGCLVAAGDRAVRLVPVLGGTCADDDAAVYASAVHAWLVAGRPLTAFTRLTLVRANTVARVRVQDRETARDWPRRAVP